MLSSTDHSRKWFNFFPSKTWICIKNMCIVVVFIVLFLRTNFSTRSTIPCVCINFKSVFWIQKRCIFKACENCSLRENQVRKKYKNKNYKWRLCITYAYLFDLYMYASGWCNRVTAIVFRLARRHYSIESRLCIRKRLTTPLILKKIIDYFNIIFKTKSCSCWQ